MAHGIDAGTGIGREGGTADHVAAQGAGKTGAVRTPSTADGTLDLFAAKLSAPALRMVSWDGFGIVTCSIECLQTSKDLLGLVMNE